MNERIIKPGVVKMIIDHTKNKNKKYTQETVNDILTAFFDVVEIAISKGMKNTNAAIIRTTATASNTRNYAVHMVKYRLMFRRIGMVILNLK